MLVLPEGPNQTGNLISVYDEKSDEKVFLGTACLSHRQKNLVHHDNAMSLVLCLRNSKLAQRLPPYLNYERLTNCTLNRPGFATICSFVKSCDDFKDYKSKLYDLCGLMDSYQSLVGS